MTNPIYFYLMVWALANSVVTYQFFRLEHNNEYPNRRIL